MRWRESCTCAVVAVSMLSLAGHGQQSGQPKTKQEASAPVQSIVLPQYAPNVPAGPHVDTYRKDCLVCHSARYVAMQPRFPQTVWEKEVKKMVDAYGAIIPEADQREIVEYLVAIQGTSESK